MKRNLLLLLSLQIAFASAQSLVVTGDNIFYGDPEVDIASYLTVKNTSAQSLRVICEKNVISQPQGASNYFCWGGTCYGSAIIISPDFTTIDAGQASTEFSGHFTGPANSVATVEYCFYLDPSQQTISLDPTCLTVTYDGNGATIINENSRHVISNFYPNPTKEVVYVDYFLNKPAQLGIMDVLGNELKQTLILERGSHEINISNFSKGIYFANLIVGNKVLAVKKLVVK